MSAFNFDAFRPVVVPVTNLDDKREKVAAASEEKKAQIANNSWSKKLGLEPTSFLSNRVNDAASLVSGASRMAGDILSLPANTFASLASDPKESAYLRGQAKEVRDTFDLGGIVDQTNRDELTGALGQDFEKEWGKVTSGWKDGKPSQVVSGLAGLLMNAGEAVVTNPSAAREYIIENAPQLLTGEFGLAGKAAMAASNVGYAADNYRTGLEEYAKQHNGALPPEAERTRMALLSATLAAAEHGGDMFQHAVGGLGKIAKAGNAVENSAEVGAQATKNGVLQSLKRTLGAGAAAGAEETLTEGYQTYAEGEINQKPASAQDIFTGGVIGGVAGAGLSGGLRATAEALKATPEHAAERVQVAAEAAAEKATIDKAVAEKSPETFLNTESPDYSPAKAVAVLHEMSKQEGVTPEQVKEHLTKSGEVISKLEDQKAQLEDSVASRDPEYISMLQDDIKAAEQSIAATDPADTKGIAAKQKELDSMNKELASLTDKEQVLKADNLLSNVTRQLADARETHHALVRLSNPIPSKSEVDTHIADANSTDKEVASKAGAVLLNLSMAAPEDLDPSSIKRLVENTKNGLTSQQRDVLRKFSEARTAENEVKKQSDVSQEILFGQKKAGGNIGIAQYRTRIAAAVASQNKASAERNLAMLGAFAQSHIEKLRAIAKAEIGDQIIKQDGKWVVNNGKRLNDKQRRENGAVNVHENSGKLIKEIQNEAKALKAAHAQLKAVVAMQFGNAVVQSAPSPDVQPAAPSISSKKTGEATPRLNDKPVQTVAEGQQNQEVSQDHIDKVNSLIDGIFDDNTSPAASPQSQPASPVAADAAPATAAQSAPAAKTTTQDKAKPEAAQQPAVRSEASTAPVAEAATAGNEEEDVLADHGKLSVMASRLTVEPGTKMKDLFANPKLNLIAQFFKQKAKSELTGGHRPLIAVKDFLSRWLGDKVVAPSDFVQLDSDPDKAAKQKAAIKHFAKLAKVWNGVLASQLAVYEKDDDFKLRDMMQYMLTREGGKVTVDENVLTAMSYGMYHWLVNEASSTGKTHEALNKMHGRDKDADFRANVYDLFDGVANIEDTAVSELGEMALQALGLTVGENAPQDLLPRLKSALGARMLVALATPIKNEKGEVVQHPFVERKAHNTQDVNSLFAELPGQKIDPKATTMYVYVDREYLAEFKDVNKGTNGIIDTLFGSEKTPLIASTKPAKFKQQYAQHTRQKVPAKLAKVLNKAQQVPHTVIPDMWSLMGAIGYDNVLKVAGFKNVDTDFIHEVNKKGVEAKNRGLKNQLDLALDMLGASDVGDIHADITTPRFVQYEVWKNFRVGVTTESLNQQASKIHRFMFARPSWTSKIDLKNEQHVNALKIAIAAAIGIKTDDQPNSETIALLNTKWTEDSDLRAAVEAVHNGLTTNQWKNGDLIANYAAGKEGMQTLQALVAYAKLMYADGDHIEVTMLVGADGKTNGPILTQLALGAASNSNGLMERMARGGIYGSAAGQPKHYSQWRKDTKGKDLYQDLASYLLRVVADNRISGNYEAAKKDFFSNPKNGNREFPFHTKAMFDAMQSILGTLESDDFEVTKEGRDLVKTPLTAFAFGSSLGGSIKAMENKFIDSIYKKIEKLAKEEHAGKNPDVAGFVRAINTLMQSQAPGMQEFDTNVRAAAMMSAEISKEGEEALRAAFRAIMGQPVRKAMESYFATFIERRGDLNRTVQASFAMYDVAYKAAREKAIQKLIASGDIAAREKTGGTKEEKERLAKLKAEGKPVMVPRTDLTEEQENAVRAEMVAMLPIAHTAYSMGGELNEGIYMGKQEAQLSNDPLRRSQITLASPVMNGKVNEDGSMGASKTMAVKGMDRVETSPGVAGTPYLIHSLDSFLMHSALADIQEALNVHDEIGHGVLEVANAAGAINRATVQALAKFSPAREALGMIERIATDLAARIKAGEVAPSEVDAIIAQWRDIYNSRHNVPAWERDGVTVEMIVNDIRAMAITNAVNADRVRLSTIAKIGVVDQYTWEDGQYQVPKSVREQALKDAQNVVTEMTQEAHDAFDTIRDFASGELVEATKQEEADPKPTMEVTDARTAAVAEVLGNPDSSEIIEQTAQAVAAMDGSNWTVFGELGRGQNSTPVNETIAQKFLSNPTMSVRTLVDMLYKQGTPAQQTILRAAFKLLPENLHIKMVTPYDTKENVVEPPKGEVHGWYVSTEDDQHFVYLKSPDFLNHGMTTETIVHELLHAALATEIAAPTSKASKSIVDDLTALMKHVAKQPGASKFEDAITDVQEFVTWGMTHPEFQALLKGIEYTASKTTKNRLVKAMKSFTEALTKLLFGESNSTKERALSVLIGNVGGLMEQAEGRKSRMKMFLAHAAPAQSYTTLDIYEALGQNANNPLSPQDDTRLRGLLNSLIETFSPIYGAFGQTAMTGTMGAASIWANAQANGTAPFALDAVAYGLAGNEQVAFMLEQVEVTMRAALSGADGVTSVAYKELTKLYEEAREALKDAVAQGKLTDFEYEFLFALNPDADNKSDYLSRFAALGLVNPKINELLRFKTKLRDNEAVADTFLGRLQQVLTEVLQWVVGRWTKTRMGEQADSKLDTLATQLVMIEAKRRARLNVEQSQTINAIESMLNSVSHGVRDKIDELANSKMFKGAKSGYLKATGALVSATVRERLDYVAQSYQDFTDQHWHHSNGMFANTLNEIRGAHDGNRVFYHLLRMAKLFEGKRKDLIAGTSKVLVESFRDGGEHLTDGLKKVVTNVFLRTDMAALLNRYTDLKDLHALLTDKAKLSKAIVEVTEELAHSPHQMYYINAAKALGYKMVSGKARAANTIQNAYSIARLHGTEQVTPQESDAIEFEPIIDQLASLYALHYSDEDQRAEAAKLMAQEMERGDEGNGIEMVLKLHQKLQADSKERLFKDQEALMMKGYTPEIYNPYIEVRLATKDELEELRDQGFGEREMKLQKADADPEPGGKYLMARHGSGLQPYQTGSISLTSMNTKGATKHNGVADLFSDQGQYNAELMHKIDRRVSDEVKRMFTHPIEPDQVTSEYLVPVLNPQGEKVNYRYMMSEQVKDTVLDRDNRFDKLMGTMAGSIYDKEGTPKQNRTVIEALHEQYQKEFKQRPRSFIEVGPRSPDPEMREIYRLLPESAKQTIREVWKSDSMMVRIDLLDMTFGYRKLSITDVFKKDRDARQGWEKLLGDVLGFIGTGKLLSEHADEEDFKSREAKAMVRLRSAEEMWQWLVKEAKDIVVVKSVSTLLGNMSSNITMLYGFGVPLTEIFRHHRIAFRGAVAYKRDSAELFALQTKLDTGTSGSAAETAEMEKRVVKLKNALAKNPVHDLIQAGLMPTIVDDVELDDDIYSYQSKFTKKVEEYTNWINKDVKAVTQQLYMGHETHVYKMLSEAAQISDFLGRYTLYQHMTTKKKDPMSKEEAIALASEAFIFYDVPTDRRTQFLNDMGFVRFTKYYLRIQKVLLALHRGNPGRALSLVALSHYFTHLPTVMDSSFYHRLGNNPLEAGVFTYPQAIGTLATYKALTLPF